MKFTAQKTKSGFALHYQPSSLENGAIDSSGKIVPIDEPYIHPKKVDDAIIYSADLDELYDDLCIEVLRIAQNFNWDEIMKFNWIQGVLFAKDIIYVLYKGERMCSFVMHLIKKIRDKFGHYKNK